jgi:hypothetical protein
MSMQPLGDISPKPMIFFPSLKTNTKFFSILFFHSSASMFFGAHAFS